jgi:membrane protein
MAIWTKQYRNLRLLAHRQTLPGFNAIPIAVILKFVWKEILRDDIVTRSNSMAFSFFISLFPGMLVMLTMLPYLPVNDLVIAFQASYADVLPYEMSSYIDGIINEMTQTGREGLLSVSVILAIFFASSGVSTMIKGFHKSYEMTYKKENLLQRQVKAVKLTLLLGVLLSVSLVGIVLGKPLLMKMLSYTGLDKTIFDIYSYIRWVLVFVIYYMGISIIYRLGPAFKNKLRLLTPGATMATILSVFSSIGFAIYVDNFANYNEVYGSIGALILILLWLQINSFIILIGYELNASIAINRDLLANVDSV